MNIKKKISLIVGLQIILIMASFLVLVAIESEAAKIGNSINYSGLNRFLTSQTVLEIHKMEFKDTQGIPSIKKLEENLYIIKEGGQIDGKTLKATPPNLKGKWEETNQSFLKFKQVVNKFESEKQMENNQYIQEIDDLGKDLIEKSDNMVQGFTEHQEAINQLLIKLQIIFLIVNTVVHLLLIILIFRIFNKESRERSKLEKFAVIGELGASIVHDLRNPLTSIKGSFEILRLKHKDPEELEKKQYEKISKSIEKIEFLTKDILEHSKIQELQKEEIGLLEIIQESINELHIPKRIKVYLPQKDIKVTADRNKIQRVISNLIKNSVGAIDDNGSITIKLDEGYDYVNCIISDSGIGIEPKNLSKIFEPLFTTKQTGTGLGLSNCKKIIEQHGGKITVKINPTTFIVSLPKNNR